MRFSKFLLTTALVTSIFSTTVFAANIGVATTGVNIREESNTSSNVVGTLNSGEEFEITGLSDNFYSIFKNGKTLYVATEFSNIKKANATVNGEGVFIRTSPSTDAEVTGMLSFGTTVTVVGQTDDWYQLQDGNKLAYIHKDYLSGDYLDRVGEPIAAVATSSTEKTSISSNYKVNASGGLNLRAEANESANVISVIPNGTILTGLSNLEGFTKVTYNGNTGYVSSSYISETDLDPSNVATLSSDATVGAQIAEWAKQYIGTPYSYGGTNLTSGVDCSGFVLSVFKQNPYYNVSLNRVAADQYNNGTRITRAELVAGDIIFFDTSGTNNGEITHAGIYMGDGQFIHASSGSAYSITISELNVGYYTSRYVGATRVIS